MYKHKYFRNQENYLVIEIEISENSVLFFLLIFGWNITCMFLCESHPMIFMKKGMVDVIGK